MKSWAYYFAWVVFWMCLFGFFGWVSWLNHGCG